MAEVPPGQPDRRAAETEAPASGRVVFVSYASPDAAIANSIVDALEKAGLKCWIAPRDVVPGEFYAGAIVHAIDAANALVLVLSESAATSQHVLREVERASSRKHPVVSFRIDLAPLPADLEYFINTSHWLDATSIGVDRALPKLVDAVQRAVGPSPGGGLTPGGATAGTPAPRASAPSAATKPPPRLSLAVIGLVAAIAVALAWLIVDKFWLAKHQAVPLTGSAITTPAIEKSIAVLPFVDRSEAKDQAYFAEGMADEVATLLAKLPGLRVIGRASSIRASSSLQDPIAIGAKLGAAYVVSGSVIRTGNRIRVTAQLVDARDGVQRWSDTYDRDFTDVLKVQDGIAVSLARALQVTVGGDYGSRPSIKDPAAYDLYLHGLRGLDSLSRADLEQAIVDFQKVVDLDPTFVPAIVGLAYAYEYSAENGWLPGKFAFERARQTAEAAIRLDPKLSDAHAALAEVFIVYDWDWPAAQREVDLAITYGGGVHAVKAAGRLAGTLGRWDEASRFFRSGLATDPLNPVLYVDLVYNVDMQAGRFAEAESAQRRVIELNPTAEGTHYPLGLALLFQGRLQEALDTMRQETVDGGQVEGLAIVYYALGKKAESAAALKLAVETDGNDWPAGIARIYAYRGELDQALAWLERAYASKDVDLYTIRHSPLITKLEGDARYKAFLRKMNLPE